MSDYSWIGPLVQAGMSYAGSQQAVGGAEQQNKLLEDAYKRALALLEGGQLSYAPERAGNLGPSAMAGVGADPESIMAQKEALGRLQEASRSGFDAIDRAAINRALSEAAIQEKGSREAALARLDPNSGAALAARMSAQQAGANRANQQALDVAALSRKRALDALGAYGGMASKMRGQSYNESANKAQANDAISRFNAETSRWNAGQGNAAKQQSINNMLRGLEVSAGAGGLYGQGLANVGNLRGQQTAGLGQGIGGAFNAWNENNKDDDSGDLNDAFSRATEGYTPEYEEDEE